MTLILSETFAPPRITTNGLRGLFQFIAEKFQLALHEQARRALAAAFCDDARHAFRAGVRTMRRAERVVHVNVRDFRQLLGKGRIVGFFLVVVANILQQQNSARRELVRRCFHFFADAIVHKLDRLCRRAFRKVSSPPGAKTSKARAVPSGGQGAPRESASRLSRSASRNVGSVSLMRVVSLMTIWPSFSSIGTL